MRAIGITVLTSLTWVLAQGAPSGEYGRIPIGGSVQGSIVAATPEAFAYHTYVIEVPPGAGPVTVQVDGMGSDLDLAVKVGAPITDYDDVDHIDTSDQPNPSFTVPNAAGTVIYVDVLNLVQRAADYAVTVSGSGAASGPAPQLAAAPSGFPAPIGPNGEAMPSGEYGPIAIGASVDGAMEAAAEYPAFHTYWIDVPRSGTDLTVAIDGMGSDLDVALKMGAPITDYDDVDHVDTSEDPNPVVEIEEAAAGRIYVDVLNLLGQPARYRLSVASGTGATGTPSVRTDAAGANPLAGRGDPLLGSFEGDGLQVLVQGHDGSYGGELVLNGQRFAFQATGGDGRLDGTFVSGGQAFAFVARLADDGLVVESGGATYRTRRTSGGAPGPVNPLAPGDGSLRPDSDPSGADRSGLASPANDPVLAEAPYGTLTHDNALAFFEALVFAHEQVGFPVELSDQELSEYIGIVSQSFPSLTPDEQLALSMSREIWSRVEANWARATAQDQQEFVIGMLTLWYGEQQVQQWFASAGGGGGGGQAGCTDIDSCFSQYASPETYGDAMNAQSCWAAAGCTDYDASSNEFSYEDTSYDAY